MDNDSGDDGTDELRQFGWEEWEKEWSGLGWQTEAGSLLSPYYLNQPTLELLPVIIL